MATDPQELRVSSARPAMTEALTRQTGLSEPVLRRFVEDFYARVRQDPELGPIFAARITDWEPHLARMADFWSSVALMTGRYHGRPIEAHEGLPVDWNHFERWLALFRETARESLAPAGAAHLIKRAERIARSLNMAVQAAAPTELSDLGRSGTDRAAEQGYDEITRGYASPPCFAHEIDPAYSDPQASDTPRRNCR